MIYIQLPTGFKRPKLPIAKITEIVGEYFDIHPEVLINPKRGKRTISDARFIVIHFALLHCKMTLREIGEYLGGRDHTTIAHGRDTIANLIEGGDPIGQDIALLQVRIDGFIELKKAA